MFVTTATATVSSTTETTGTFDATVPDHTRIIHFVANQNMSEFPENTFSGKSETEVMALLQGSSGKMIYWARFACDKENTGDKIDKQLQSAGNSIRLIRNHARISVNETTQNNVFTVTGFKVYNTNGFGTVAPYHPEKGFDFSWDEIKSVPFVTLPLNRAKMDDFQDVTTELSQYVFECENNLDDPVSVIIRGHHQGETQDSYYRVMLVDENGDQLLICRNHHYIVNIVGELSYGQPTFGEALEAAATNNVWIAISDEVTAVEDNSYRLSVAQTSYVLDSEEATSQGYSLAYTVEAKNGTPLTDADKPDITWLEGNTVAQPRIVNDFNPATGAGTVTITTYALGENVHRLEGTLLVKKGRLQRKIKVVKIKKQSFVPAWMGAQLYGKITDLSNRPKATAVFTIPESCPDELFPMRVLISANELDVRSASGMKLDIIRKGEPGYGEDNGWGYKYVYTATASGGQRIYFESILNQAEMAERKVVIEAAHFEPVELKFHFSEKNRAITMPKLSQYNAGAGGNGPKDEPIYYRMVPQKKKARVVFYMELHEMGTDYTPQNAINAGESDEFLVYNSNLFHYNDDEYADAGLGSADKFDCEFFHDEATAWSDKQVNMGQVCMFKARKPNITPELGDGVYQIYMYTTKAKSAETVRIASNLPTLDAVLERDGNTTGSDMDDDGVIIGPGKYKGNIYRSTIFELANYSPFRFAAGVNWNKQGFIEEGTDDAATGDVPEKVTDLEWSYEPGREVDIEFDITSFRGMKDVNKQEYESVDPFGQQFDIFIDAPMLEIDENRLGNLGGKLRKDSKVSGRFIYTVDANREKERTYGQAEAYRKDEMGGVDQSGERKRLPFKVKSAVSAGDITVSSDEDMVVYFAKTFRVSNRPISGSLRYKLADGIVQDVPQHTFVPFERTGNNSRIGAITVVGNGKYELRLRREYDFNWYTHEVELRCEISGTIYSAKVRNLATLFSNPDIVLEPVSAGN
ncbi:hypothetical protein [uncultured Bacteroides sp.]|uniref:hypothetical protein n=1 Tax=uncultured Bacteroides sp. TaxID=162156 RepID=UPI0025987F13|nr:hypothetical protein [uncultured Bacteroides sp.]